MKQDFLKIEVAKEYPEFLLAANLTVAEGEFFSLVGPSGCGKTTLLRLISGLAVPDRGRVILNGQDLTGVAVAKRRIGFVFQDYALFPHLTVKGNIEYGLKVCRLSATQREKRLAELLALFELEALVDRRIQEISGGERQRVALARALAPEPFLLLLDEPFAALDYGLRRRLRRELKALQTQLGFTAIFVTHQQEEALSLSHRLAVMEGGRILQVGSAPEVYSKPGHPFVAEFLGDANLVPCTVEVSVGGMRVIPKGGAAFTLSTEEGISEPGAYLLMIRPEDVVLAAEGEAVFSGEVVTVEYLGHGFYGEIKTDDGLILKILTEKTTVLRPGQTGGVSFRKQALKLIPIN
jgi:ABC-type Fe3+/spermidine/putrescine transport system ATPase subunit